jgi:hypothetical protein
MFHEFIMQVGLKKISGKLSTQNNTTDYQWITMLNNCCLAMNCLCSVGASGNNGDWNS